MISQSVTLRQAVVSGNVKHVVKAGTVTTIFSISSPLTSEAADALGVKALLYCPDGLSNSQYQSINLRPIEETLRIFLEPEGVPTEFNTVVDRCDLSVSAGEEGLNLTTKFTMTGNQYAIVEFLLHAGEAPCRFVIEKAQGTLDLEVAGADNVEPTSDAGPAEQQADTEGAEPKVKRGRKPKAVTVPAEEVPVAAAEPEDEGVDHILVHFTRIGV